jgi:hypothetical protein
MIRVQKVKPWKLSICFLIAGTFASLGCEPNPDCFSANTTFVNVKFFDTTNNAVIDTMFESVFALSNPDSLLYSSSEGNRQNFQLFVNPEQDSTAFVFCTLQFGIFSYDTLALRYRRRQRIIGLACDLEQFYDNLQIGFTTYDTLRLKGTRLDQTVSTHVEVVDVTRIN